jgi:hypothetical protein
LRRRRLVVYRLIREDEMVARGVDLVRLWLCATPLCWTEGVVELAEETGRSIVAFVLRRSYRAARASFPPSPMSLICTSCSKPLSQCTVDVVVTITNVWYALPMLQGCTVNTPHMNLHARRRERVGGKEMQICETELQHILLESLHHIRSLAAVRWCQRAGRLIIPDASDQMFEVA